MSSTRKPRSRGIRASIATSALALAVAGTAFTQGGVSVASENDRSRAEIFPVKLVTIKTLTPSDKSAVAALGLDLTEHAGRDYMEAVIHTPADLAALQESGYEYNVRIPDMVARNIEIAQINDAFRKSVATSSLPSGNNEYRDLFDYNRDMANLVRKNRNLVKRFALPRKSLDGRTIFGVEIGHKIGKPLAGQPTFVLMGIHHAREWPSGEMAMEFATDLVKNFGKNGRITRLLKQARVIVIPVVNVDGFRMSRNDGDYIDLRDLNEFDPLGGSTSILATPGRAYMRKNCRIVDGQDTQDGTCQYLLATPGGFGHGVDLNRNYGGLWGGPGAAGGTPDAIADPTYRGAAPFSEPETQNIQDLVRERQVTMLISNHTFGNLLLRPNGQNPNTLRSDGLPVGNSPDEEGMKKLGAEFRRATGYANIHGWELYDTTGTTEDYTYNATGGYGYTFEIGPNEFHPPFPEVISEYVGAGKYKGKGLRETYLTALEHAVDTEFSGTLRVKAPKGARLRLKKNFRTPTWDGSFADFINTKIKVPGKKVSKKQARKKGKNRFRKFDWIVNPSTRPAVRPRTFQVVSEKPFAATAQQGTPAAPTQFTDHEFVVNKNAAQIQIDLDWDTPDDLDLEVYRQLPGGELEEVGTSGNAPGEKESVTLVDQPRGTYVMRVINYASAAPTYTVTGQAFDATLKSTPGKIERYTLTCEKPNGKVLERKKILIKRGQTKTYQFKKCERKF